MGHNNGTHNPNDIAAAERWLKSLALERLVVASARQRVLSASDGVSRFGSVWAPMTTCREAFVRLELKRRKGKG